MQRSRPERVSTEWEETLQRSLERDWAKREGQQPAGPDALPEGPRKRVGARGRRRPQGSGGRTQ